MSDFFGKLKSGAEKVAFEAEKMNKQNRAKGELEKIKSQIQAQFVKLGEMVYTQRASMGINDPAFNELFQSITDLEHQVDSKNEEIQRINAETFAAPGTQPAPQAVAAPAATPSQSSTPPAPAPVVSASKFCPNCGKENLATAKFCTDCGTSL